MNYPYTSNFPNTIDGRTFFYDVDLDTISYMNTYVSLIEQGKYEEANAFIHNSPAHIYSANLINYAEARTKTLQEYILTLEKYNPYILSDDEPDAIEVNEFWI